MRRALGVLAIGLLAAGCGGSAANTAGGSHSPSSGPDTAAQAAAYAKCKAAVTPFLGKLSDLNSRLDVGLTPDEYGSALGDARVTYDHTKAAMLHSGCLSVGADLEAAFNHYIDANNTWQNCISVGTSGDSCGGLQPAWAAATRSIGKARSALAALRP